MTVAVRRPKEKVWTCPRCDLRQVMKTGACFGCGEPLKSPPGLKAANTQAPLR